MLREHGVVGKLVEFFGPGLATLPLADRATIANMSPEYGATCGIFPVDQAALDYLELTGRDRHQIALVDAYMREQGLFHTAEGPEAEYTAVLDLDLAMVEPSLAGPRRPQDRVLLADLPEAFRRDLEGLKSASSQPEPRLSTLGRWEMEGGDTAGLAVAAPVDHAGVEVTYRDQAFRISHGAVVIAAITSCTNTSNPSVMVGAGLLAKKAVERGLTTKPWASTSSATAARPASATAARCRSPSARPWSRGVSSSVRCSPGTGTSRGASTPTCGRTTSPRRPWSSLTR
jgi:aconitate hydratase